MVADDEANEVHCYTGDARGFIKCWNVSFLFRGDLGAGNGSLMAAKAVGGSSSSTSSPDKAGATPAPATGKDGTFLTGVDVEEQGKSGAVAAQVAVA